MSSLPCQLGLFCAVAVLSALTPPVRADALPGIIATGVSCPAGKVIEFSNQPVNVPKLAGKSPERELAYWNDVKTSGDVSQLLVFITNFPEGTYVEPAVELYKQKCGDLTQLPSIVLTCKPADLSVAPKRRKFLPPPKIVPVEPPKVEYVPPIIVRHRRKPPVIVVGKDHPAHLCKNGNYIGAANCGDPPNEPFGGSHGAGKEGTSGGNSGTGKGRGNRG